jgi:ubiquinone biosynthesis protein
VAVLATSMALVAALAWASRRLLGLSVGLLRAFIAGLLGFATAVLLGQALRAAQPGHEVAFLSVALGVPLIVAMIFLVRRGPSCRPRRRPRCSPICSAWVPASS